MAGASGRNWVGGNYCDIEASKDVGTGSGWGSTTGREVGSGSASASSTPVPVEGHVNDGNIINNVWNHASRIGTQDFTCNYFSLTKKGGGATRGSIWVE